MEREISTKPPPLEKDDTELVRAKTKHVPFSGKRKKLGKKKKKRLEYSPVFSTVEVKKGTAEEQIPVFADGFDEQDFSVKPEFLECLTEEKVHGKKHVMLKSELPCVKRGQTDPLVSVDQPNASQSEEAMVIEKVVKREIASDGSLTKNPIKSVIMEGQTAVGNEEYMDINDVHSRLMKELGGAWDCVYATKFGKKVLVLVPLVKTEVEAYSQVGLCRGLPNTTSGDLDVNLKVGSRG